jgi:DNA-binding GntR family transcriptional regulator
MSTTISDHIRGDLADRIGSGLGPPAALTLAALAKHYGVSFTPVREALRGLVSDGLLLKHGDGRVRVNPGRAKARPRGRPAAEVVSEVPPNRAAELESALAAGVIAASLRGGSDYLREEATARRFGVGRTAIRQALGRLAGRGLVVHVPRCGWRVRPFDEADLDAYLEVRELMELKALDLARPRLDHADLARMLRGNEPGGPSPRLDNGLHRYLVEKSGNAYLRDFFERHGAYYTTLFDFAAPETHVVAEMARQHRAILEALIARDWPRARRSLAEHIRGQRPIVKDLMQRVGRSATDPNPQTPPSRPNGSVAR